MLPKIGIGAWAWGDTSSGATTRREAELQELFDYYVATPHAFFDTPPSAYVVWASETPARRALNGRSREASGLASSFRRSVEADAAACEGLRGFPPTDGRDSMELVSDPLHERVGERSLGGRAGRRYDMGLAAVGVSNYGGRGRGDERQRSASVASPSANQIQYSLLYPFANQNGLKKKCDELGVKIAALAARPRAALRKVRPIGGRAGTPRARWPSAV